MSRVVCFFMDDVRTPFLGNGKEGLFLVRGLQAPSASPSGFQVPCVSSHEPLI